MKIKEKKGMLITFEGPDGSGKTSTTRKVAEELGYRGFPVVITREPGGTDCPVAEQIRNLIINPPSQIFPVTEMLLFAAARRQHVQKFIIPNLKKGKIILSDRFLDSSLVFQGVGRGLGIDLVRIINSPAVGDISPDITFLLNLPDIEIALERMKGRKLDRFEKEGIHFHETIKQAYLRLAQNNPKIVIVNATLPLKKVVNIVLTEIIRDIPAPEYFQGGDK